MNFEITPQELKEMMDNGDDVFLLDVREQDEFDFVNLEGYLIPLGQLQDRIEELESEKYTVVYCHHGVRSAQAVQLLINFGFKTVQNLMGGIDLWTQEINPSVPRY